MKTHLFPLAQTIVGLALTVFQSQAQSIYEPYTFTTFAGSVPGYGSADGTGSAAQFHNPWGVAVDSAGNVYVADTSNNTIRKVTRGGVVTTLAGLAGSAGSADGTGSAARFNSPEGVAVDSAGNIYVADNSTIREVAPVGTNWVVTTLAGLAGSYGSADGTGSAAQFGTPHGVAVDSAGNVYVADTWNSTIRKVTPVGTNWVVTTLAGLAGSYGGSADGTGSAAQFFYPWGVAVDSVGNVYVADGANSTIRKVTPEGVVTTLAGHARFYGSADGTGSAAQFAYPNGVAVDVVGNVYVADDGNNTIRKVTPAGVVTTLAGLAGSFGSADGTGSAALFGYPSGVAVDSAGNIYVTDNSTIRKVTPVGTNRVVTTLAGSAGYGSADGTGSAAQFNGPFGVAVDSAGNIYVADEDNNTIRKVTPAGVVTTLAGKAGVGPGSADGTGSAAQFYNPSGVAVDSVGNVYVADKRNTTIRKVTPAGVVTTLAGLAGSYGSADGTGSAAQFTGPIGVAVDSAGNIYVADSGNNTIRKVTPVGTNWVVTTLAGLAGSYGSADGTAGDARFSYPEGVAVDSAGNVYVADTGNATIRKVTPAGVVTTLAGKAGSYGSADGTGSAAVFGRNGGGVGPFGLAVDNLGNVYVADTENRTIRKVTPEGVVTTLAGLPAFWWDGNVGGTTDGTGSAAWTARATFMWRTTVRYAKDTQHLRLPRLVPSSASVAAISALI